METRRRAGIRIVITIRTVTPATGRRVPLDRLSLLPILLHLPLHPVDFLFGLLRYPFLLRLGRFRLFRLRGRCRG